MRKVILILFALLLPSFFAWIFNVSLLGVALVALASIVGFAIIAALVMSIFFDSGKRN